jgi:hypothetical protein
MLLSVYAELAAAGEELQLSSARRVFDALVQAFAAMNAESPWHAEITAFVDRALRLEVVRLGVSKARVIIAVLASVAVVRHFQEARLPELLQRMWRSLETTLLAHPLFNPQQLLFFLRHLLVREVAGAAAGAAGAVGARAGDVDAAEEVNASMFETAHEKPLADVRRWLMALWDASAQPPPEVATDDAVIADIRTLLQSHVPLMADRGAIARVCLAWLLVEPVSTFHSFLMHSAYSVQDFKTDLGAVSLLASRAKRCSANGFQCPVVRSSRAVLCSRVSYAASLSVHTSHAVL